MRLTFVLEWRTADDSGVSESTVAVPGAILSSQKYSVGVTSLLDPEEA